MRKPKRKNIIFCAAALCVVLIVVVFLSFLGKKQVNVWYVEQGLENAWVQVLSAVENPPENFAEIAVWDGSKIPSGAGILITAKPWQTDEKVFVYPRLSWELEYQGAVVLALDPWMVFRKHMNPVLTYERLSETGGDGILLIAGRDISAVRAWTSRFIQEEPGKFPYGEDVWLEWEQKLFAGSRFLPGAHSYDWESALLRLMGNETAWLYAPLSKIRGYGDPRKAILEATPFPENGNQYSLQAALLWALPTGSAKEKEKLTQVMDWLKNPNTQTIIADTLEWIPSDPYGVPYDPVSLSSHRVWLTASFVYTLND